MRLRIIEAVMSHNSKNEKQINLLDVAKTIWPDSQESAQQVNISKLVNGHTKKSDPTWIKAICELTGVEPNFLFGFNSGKFDW